MSTPADAAYYDALEACAARYSAMTPDPFAQTFEDGVIARLPIPKLCRWLGYLQRLCVEQGATTVEAERDWTRPLFRPLDFPAKPLPSEEADAAPDWPRDRAARPLPDPSEGGGYSF